MSATDARSAREIAMGQVQPTGKVNRDGVGLELIVSRRFPAPAAEAWEWVTSSANLKRWFGSFRGGVRVGRVIPVKLMAEEGTPSVEMAVLECLPGKRYVVEQSPTATPDAAAPRPGPLAAGAQLQLPWHLTVSVADLGGSSMVFLAHRLDNARDAGSVGPGWEYYLDRMLAAWNGTAMPDFADYFPSQRPYYERLAMDGDPVAWPAS